ncbi:unnamed protein product [Boreogadus saida]
MAIAVGDTNEVTGSTPVPPPQPDKNSAVECPGLSLDPLPLPRGATAYFLGGLTPLAVPPPSSNPLSNLGAVGWPISVIKP